MTPVEFQKVERFFSGYAKIINGTKKSTKNCTQKIFSTGLKQKQGHNQQKDERQMREKEMCEKQRERDKRYIRRPNKPEVQKYRYCSESEIESEPEAYYNYGYDESNGKILLPKNKIKRDSQNFSEDEKNAKTEEEEEEEKVESKSENDIRKIKKQTKQNKLPPNKKTENVKIKKGIIDYINK